MNAKEHKHFFRTLTDIDLSLKASHFLIREIAVIVVGEVRFEDYRNFVGFAHDHIIWTTLATEPASDRHAKTHCILNQFKPVDLGQSRNQYRKKKQEA